MGDDNQPHNQFHVFLGFENQAYKTNNQELCQMISNKLRNLLLNTISVKKNQYGNAYEETNLDIQRVPMSGENYYLSRKNMQILCLLSQMHLFRI